MFRLVGLSGGALPVPGPIHGRRQRGGTEANGAELFAVAGPALVFPPRHFGGIAVQVLAADPVILAPLRTAQTGEVALRLIGAGVIRAVGFLVVDALHVNAGMQGVPTGGFVGMDGGGAINARLDEGDAFLFGTEDLSDSPAVTLTGHDNHLTLARLVLGKATVLPVFLAVLGTDMTTDIAAVNFHVGAVATQHDATHFRRHGFPELVGQHVSRLVLHVEIAAELESGDALDRVDEDDDGDQVIPDRQLARSKQGAGSFRELAAPRLALEDVPGGVLVALRAIALGADGGALGVGPADLTEQRAGFPVRHARNLFQADGASGGGHEEVLRHGGVFVCFPTYTLALSTLLVNRKAITYVSFHALKKGDEHGSEGRLVGPRQAVHESRVEAA